jgi:hypothetical protein
MRKPQIIITGVSCTLHAYLYVKEITQLILLKFQTCSGIHISGLCPGQATCYSNRGFQWFSVFPGKWCVTTRQPSSKLLTNSSFIQLIFLGWSALWKWRYCSTFRRLSPLPSSEIHVISGTNVRCTRIYIHSWLLELSSCSWSPFPSYSQLYKLCSWNSVVK